MVRTLRPVMRGTNYAISSRKSQATQVGERILRSGGNAFDAAVAAFAALAVTDPAMTGLGGDAFVLIYHGAQKRVLSINAGGTAPKLATIEWFQQHAGGKIPVNDGLLAASLPGAFDACYILLDRWGTMTFGELLAPAIELARAGFPISEYFADYLTEFAGKLRKYPTTARIYHPLRPGDILRNPDLARTMEALVAAEQRGGLKGARDEFYRGDIARAMASFCEQNGGLYRYEDFAEYQAKVEQPVSIDYRGYRVFKNASATQGPTELFLLNLLAGYDLKALGHNTPDYIHTCVEAAKLAYADRERYLGDMDFIHIPFERLLSKEYADERRALIDPRQASMELRPGTPNLAGAADGTADHGGDTSYVAVVDKHGNAVSFTPSLHSAFGTGIVMGDLGLILNCRGDYYELDPQHPNSLVPGKRARSTLAPTIVMKDGELAMVLGSPGGDDQPMRIAQTFLNLVDFGMNIQEAIEAPRWSTTSFPASEFPHTMYPGHVPIEDRIPEHVHSELERRGHNVDLQGAWTLGATSAIVIDQGVLSAGADPRGDGYALAW